MNKPIRICIVGNSGTGKSMLANRLARRLSIPAYHLDRELLYGQFKAYDFEEQQARHQRIITEDNWVIDGNYRNLMPDRIKRATLVVFLDISRVQAVFRAIKRYWKNDQLGSSIPQEAKNGFDWKFMKWILTYSRRRYLEQIKSENPAQLLIMQSGTSNQWVDKIIAAIKQDNDKQYE